MNQFRERLAEVFRPKLSTSSDFGQLCVVKAGITVYNSNNDDGNDASTTIFDANFTTFHWCTFQCIEHWHCEKLYIFSIQFSPSEFNGRKNVCQKSNMNFIGFGRHCLCELNSVIGHQFISTLHFVHHALYPASHKFIGP